MQKCVPNMNIFFGVWSDNCKRLFLMLATINPAEWTATGKNTQEYSLSLSQWYKNHFGKNDYRCIIGDVWEDRNKLELVFETLT